MPILHAQIIAQVQAPDGQILAVPPDQALQAKGPTVQVTIGPAASLVDQWTQQGITLPTPVTGDALIDTGAATTCIDDAIAQQLGLPVVDVVQMASASHISNQNVYPIQVIFPNGLTVNVERAMGAAIGVQGIAVLIGRDILQHCTLHYNGIAGSFTVAI